MQILHGETDDSNLRQLRNDFSTTTASPQSSLLLVPKMPAGSQAALAAGQAAFRSRLPGQPARRPTRLARPEPRLLGQLPRKPIQNPESRRKFSCAGPTQRFHKIGRVTAAVRAVPATANHGFAIGTTWWMAGRTHARLPRLSLQKGCVPREDLIDGLVSGSYRRLQICFRSPAT